MQQASFLLKELTQAVRRRVVLESASGDCCWQRSNLASWLALVVKSLNDVLTNSDIVIFFSCLKKFSLLLLSEVIESAQEKLD